MPGQGRGRQRAARGHPPGVAQRRVIVRNQGRQAGLVAAGRRCRIARAVHMGGDLEAPMPALRFMRSIAVAHGGAGMGKMLIMEKGNRAFRGSGMQHEHHRCQNRERSRKLLPEQRSFPADGQPFHAAGTPGTRSCSMPPHDPSGPAFIGLCGFTPGYPRQPARQTGHQALGLLDQRAMHSVSLPDVLARPSPAAPRR